MKNDIVYILSWDKTAESERMSNKVKVVYSIVGTSPPRENRFTPHLNQSEEDGDVRVGHLGGVEVTQRPHKNALLVDGGIAALERTGHAQHRLHGSQTPVVVRLR